MNIRRQKYLRPRLAASWSGGHPITTAELGKRDWKVSRTVFCKTQYVWLWSSCLSTPKHTLLFYALCCWGWGYENHLSALPPRCLLSKVTGATRGCLGGQGSKWGLDPSHLFLSLSMPPQQCFSVLEITPGPKFPGLSPRPEPASSCLFLARVCRNTLAQEHFRKGANSF